MKLRCINPELGRKITLEIGFNAARGAGISLSPAHCKHLMDCTYCREKLPTLFTKAESSQKSMCAYEIFKMAEVNDPRVLRRATHQGLALFRGNDNEPTIGLYVLVGEDNRIHDPEEMTLEDFNRLN